jgi:hypothetical protein
MAMAVSRTVRPVCAPSGKAVAGVTLQVPSVATTAVWTSPVGKVTVMVSPAVPVPLTVAGATDAMPCR